MIGTVLEDTYRVERRIGGGGMGVVYEVAHLRINRRFAAKFLTREMAGSAEALARFRQEAMVTSSLGNPHIVEVLDFNHTADGTPYIIMELLQGEDLLQLLRREQRLPLLRVAGILRQAAAALQAAHARGIVHRDLKPANIFLCQHDEQDDYVKLLDFGISKVLGSSSAMTGTRELLGSPSYMSPEQARVRSGEVDQTADVFSMASIVYLMLAGAPPFQAETTPGLLYLIVNKEPPALGGCCPGLPAAVDQVMARAMHKDPKQRYPSMLDFWQEFAGAAGVPADPNRSSLALVEPSLEDQPTNMAPARATSAVARGEVSETDLTLVRADVMPHTVVDNQAETVALSDAATEAATLAVELARAPTQPPAAAPPAPSPPVAAPPVVATASPPVTQPTEPLTGIVQGLDGGPQRRQGFSTTQVVLVSGLTLALGIGVALTPMYSSVRQPADDAGQPRAEAPASPDARIARATQDSGTRVKLRSRVAVAPRKKTVKRRKATPRRSSRPPRPAATKKKPPGPRPAARPQAGKRATLRVMTISGGQPMSCEIYLDGKMAGRSPLFARGIPEGYHTVEARAPGHEAVTRRVKLLAAHNNKVVLTISR